MKLDRMMRWGDGSCAFYFNDNAKDYLVRRSAKGLLIYKVGFTRITRNVFGNGSKCVLQAGYRTLPEGPTLLRLEAAYKRLSVAQIA